LLYDSRFAGGSGWTYEIKLDGYRLQVVQSAGRTAFYSRRQNLLNQKFRYIATAPNDLSDPQFEGEVEARRNLCVKQVPLQVECAFSPKLRGERQP
jgi:ATP-dependent DNA ligase